MKVVGNVPRVSGAIKLSTHVIYKVSHWEVCGGGHQSVHTAVHTARLPQAKLRGKIKT